jgi:membrane-associated protease RseP (regulator of RpoE activity)
MGFIIFDLAFLVVFTIGVVIFLKTRTHNLEKQGWIYLYRTKLGMKFIEKVSKKYAKILKPMQYLVVIVGYILMILILLLIFQTTYVYLTDDRIAETLKAPPIVPLIPYFTTIFGLESFFPPFYFTYFIIAIIIVAFVHEFAHGIFARLNKIKIHSTGFAFLGPILGAFVEQDEKQMNKAKKFPQLAILGAGVFANVITGIIFMALLWVFFASVFIPAGAQFAGYTTSIIDLSQSEIPTNFLDSDDLVEIHYNNKTFLAPPQPLQKAIDEEATLIEVLDNAPAINARLPNIITEINGFPINSYEELVREVTIHSPGDEITITALDAQGLAKTYKIELGEREGRAFLGIGFTPTRQSTFFRTLYFILSGPEDPNTYYESKIGDSGIFIRHLLWWIVLINVLVALFNMLPVGILDGGRFFFLTIWGITGSKKTGQKAFSFITWLILFLVILLMIKWVTIFL